ncbi:MAG: endopeptidase La [Myxococcales bacterium]|nr:endopeptidase La [Myxococcales bacterium]
MDKSTSAGPSLPVLPLRKDIVFPGMLAPLMVATPGSLQAVEAAATSEDKSLLVGFQRDAELDEPKRADLLDLGVLCVVRGMQRRGNVIQLLVQGDRRVTLDAAEQESPYLRCSYRDEPVSLGNAPEVEGRQRAVLDEARSLDEHRDPRLTPLFTPTLAEIDDPIQQLYAVATLLDLDREKRAALLRANTQTEALDLVAEAVRYEAQIAQVRHEVAAQAGQKMSRQARERFLREQLDAIRKELGDTSAEEAEVAELRRRLDEAELPDIARKEATRGLEHLERISPMSPEYQLTRTHLDFILELPWTRSSTDRIDLDHARAVLDEDHYGLDDVKDRILEHLAVLKLNPTAKAPILCFVGPPGVGKTSLGRSIARSLGREFERLSLGGLHDEAELRGHRRTYIGAMPGRILQAIRRAGVRNPLLMLDEVDKLGQDFRGDPAAALLEILDPAQNIEFHDNYLDLPFDLSQVFFITTANALDPIPRPLLDRMEVLPLAGYSGDEKREIARRYLIPRQLEQAGIDASQLALPDETLEAIIRRYTREAGVRELERTIGRVARKVAMRVVRGESGVAAVAPDDLKALLGPDRAFDEVLRKTLAPGVAAGLAWTESGGDVLYVEGVLLPEGRGLTLTGQLGKVMQESAQAAQSYMISQAAALGIDAARAEKSGVHIHVPAGAIPKDGPSAGVTMATALASLYSDRPVRADTAMTGEITLSGLVLPVGGIREKVLAAHRAGLRRIILPERNEADLEKLPTHVRDAIEFIRVDSIEAVLAAALTSAEPALDGHLEPAP